MIFVCDAGTNLQSREDVRSKAYVTRVVTRQRARVTFERWGGENPGIVISRV